MNLSKVIMIGMVLAISGCATDRAALDGPSKEIRRGSVAVMTAPTEGEAWAIKESLLGGKALPRSAKILPVSRLDEINPELSKAAVELADCEISDPIPPPEGSPDTTYTILQRGGLPDSGCGRGRGRWSFSEFFKQVEEKTGQLFIGILVVAVTAASIALPFILFD